MTLYIYLTSLVFVKIFETSFPVRDNLLYMDTEHNVRSLTLHLRKKTTFTNYRLIQNINYLTLFVILSSATECQLETCKYLRYD